MPLIPVKQHYRRKPKQPPALQPSVLTTQDSAKVLVVTPQPPQQEEPKPTMKEKLKKTFALPKRKRNPVVDYDEFAETAQDIAETVEKVKK